MDRINTYLAAQKTWSGLTFGLGHRSISTYKHMLEEIEECKADPKDIFEYVDVMILCWDALWRLGLEADDIRMQMLAQLGTEKPTEWFEFDPLELDPEPWIRMCIVVCGKVCMAGFTTDEFWAAMEAKQKINFERKWDIGNGTEPARHIELCEEQTGD